MPTEDEIRKIKWLIAAITFLVIASFVSVKFIDPLLSMFFSFLGFVVIIYLIYYMRKIEKQWDKNK